jgi:hypothetical protein
LGSGDNQKRGDFLYQKGSAARLGPGSLNIKGGRGFLLFLSKRWNLDGIFFLLFYLTNPAQQKAFDNQCSNRCKECIVRNVAHSRH